MLSEKLQEQKTLIEGQISYYQGLENKNQEILQQMLQNQREMNEIDNELSQVRSQKSALSTVRVKNKFAKIFLRVFSAKYRRETVINQGLKSKIEQLNVRLKELLEQNGAFRNEQIDLKGKMEECDIESLRQKSEQQKDTKKSISVLLENQPELRENEEFMKDLVGVSSQYIAYDKTDSPDVYLKLFRSLDEETIQKEAEGFDPRYISEAIEYLEEELKNPKECERDKYKIPHKYLFEAIRKSKTIKGMCDQIREYKSMDGELPLEYGNKFQSLYEDKDNYLLIHGVFLNSYTPEETQVIKESICKNGLMTTDKVNCLNATTNGTYRNDCSFLAFFKPNDYVYGQLPKEAIDKKTIPVWGADNSTIEYNDFDRRSYVLPEYIVGYGDKENLKIVNNPVPIEKRKQYTYKFYEGELQGFKDKTKDKEGFDR